MIDLHLHTTASDGLLDPAALAERAARAGLSVISVTDHDTVAGLSAARAAAERVGIRLVPGIEITAVEDERDVHVLGYFFDPEHAALASFLEEQRADRRRRVREMASRLADLGYIIDVDALFARAARSSVGRPALADALVSAGYVANRDEAFATLLGRGCPAFVPRRGVPGAGVVHVIHRAGGVAALAHPGLLANDDLIAPLAAAGLDAIEVWHSDHSLDDEIRYAAIAERLGLARSGGSDFHGDGVHRASRLGGVSLPPSEFEKLERLAGSA